MSSIKELIFHSSSYFTGRFLILVAGFISMPILTRILTKEDYGLLSLVFLSLTMLSTIACFGFPQATTRFYAEYQKKGTGKHIREFCTSMTAGSVLTGTIAVLIAIGSSYLLENSRSFSQLAQYLRLASILILIRVVTGVVLQIYRAEKRILVYNFITVANRYLTVLCSILLVVFVYNNIKGVLVATIVVEGIIVVLCLLALYSMGNLGFGFEPSKFITRAIKFGFPLVIADLLITLVASSDRFAIQYFIGSEAVASYSIAYDLSDYVSILFATSIQLAIMPTVYEMWVKEGSDSTSYFVSRAIKYVVVMIIPIIFGFSVLGEDIIVMVASEKYAGSGVLVPFIVSGVMLLSINFLFSVGLLIHKKTVVLMLLNLSCAAINIILNLILIPRYGIVGAAYATFITCIFLFLMTYKLSSKYLRIRVEWKLILKSLFISIGMVFFLGLLGDISNKLIFDVFFKIIVGFLFFAILFLVIDKEIRNLAHKMLFRV